jgi:cephalosporin hydroxylase
MVAGGFAYGYLFMAQHHNAKTIFSQFLNNVKPSRILEIGTMHGGLTLMLRDILDEINLYDSIIRTYDINNQDFLRPLVTNRKVEVLTKNLFNDNYTNFRDIDAQNEIAEFIQKEGLSIVLCDGGCKRCEFNLIAPLLKTNDIIMAHDYAPNHHYFTKNMKDKIWDWMEIQDSDIENISKIYQLQPYYQDLLINIAWCCRRSATK